MKHEKRLTLNARKMDTREHAHEHLKKRLHLPDWYGGNLDALNDCLGEIGEPTQIIVRFAPELTQMPGDYGARLMRVLEQAADENENLRITPRTWL